MKLLAALLFLASSGCTAQLYAQEANAKVGQSVTADICIYGAACHDWNIDRLRCKHLPVTHLPVKKGAGILTGRWVQEDFCYRQSER